MKRFLGIVERRLGVQFPDTYVDAVRDRRAVTTARFGELFTPDRCSWYEYDAAPENTMLWIGMHHRGDARPLLMRRPDVATPMLDDAIYVLRDGRLVELAPSLVDLHANPSRRPA